MELHYTKETLPKSQAVLTITIPKARIEKHVDKAVKTISEKMVIDGFRPGHIPRDILVKKVGELSIWEEALQEEVTNAYIEILTKEKENLPVLGRPAIAITKLPLHDDAEIKITVSLYPDLKLADYKKVAKEIGKEKLDLEVKEEEVTEAIKMLQKMRVQEDASKKNGADKAPKLSEIKDEDLPELTDEFAISLSSEFKGVEDLKNKLRENIVHEKTHRLEDARRTKMIETIVEETACELPDILVEYELDRIFSQFEHDIASNGIKFEDYLKHISKTKEEVRTEMKPDAEKRAKMQLVLHKISELEKVEINQVKLDTELGKIKEMYAQNPDFSEEGAKAYLETVLLNQAVIEAIEKLGGIENHNC